MKLLSIVEIAAQLSVSRATINRMVAEGILPAITLRSGKRKRVLRFRQEVIDRWLVAQERQGAHRLRPNGNTAIAAADLAVRQENGGIREH
jgi:excisionase family DNA binding protein